MKKNIYSFIFYTVFAFFSLVSTIEGQAVSYHFQFQIKGLAIPEKCILGYYSGDLTYAIDSLKASKVGQLYFKGQRDLPAGMYF